MISLQCNKYKEKYKSFICEKYWTKEIKWKYGKKIQTLEDSLSQVSKTENSYIAEKLRKEVACLTKDFEKFLESSSTLTMVLKFYQHLHGKSGLGL